MTYSIIFSDGSVNYIKTCSTHRRIFGLNSGVTVASFIYIPQDIASGEVDSQVLQRRVQQDIRIQVPSFAPSNISLALETHRPKSWNGGCSRSPSFQLEILMYGKHKKRRFTQRFQLQAIPTRRKEPQWTRKAGPTQHGTSPLHA